MVSVLLKKTKNSKDNKHLLQSGYVHFRGTLHNHFKKKPQEKHGGVFYLKYIMNMWFKDAKIRQEPPGGDKYLLSVLQFIWKQLSISIRSEHAPCFSLLKQIVSNV